MILGDLNLHLDKTDLLETVKFNTLLNIHGLMQKVDFSTHCSGHILDVMIVREHDSSFFHPECVDPCLSDHKALWFKHDNQKTPINLRK